MFPEGEPLSSVLSKNVMFPFETRPPQPSRLHLVSSCHLHFNSSSHLKSLESCLSSCLLSLALFFLENLCSQRTQQVQSKATCRNQVLHCLGPARDLSDFNGTNVLICCIVLFVLSVFADVFADLKQEAPLNGANRRDRMRIRTELQDIHSVTASPPASGYQVAAPWVTQKCRCKASRKSLGSFLNLLVRTYSMSQL